MLLGLGESLWGCCRPPCCFLTSFPSLCSLCQYHSTKLPEGWVVEPVFQPPLLFIEAANFSRGTALLQRGDYVIVNLSPYIIARYPSPPTTGPAHRVTSSNDNNCSPLHSTLRDSSRACDTDAALTGRIKISQAFNNQGPRRGKGRVADETGRKF